MRSKIRLARLGRVEGTHVHEVAIVGAGFGGLGLAIRLKQEGIEDFVVLEREADVGGTWWSNSYPGCQCDIPSNLYSFSFAPKPDWTRAYPLRDELVAYLKDCAERFGVMPHVRLDTELLEATWVAERQCWELETAAGPLAARVLVSAVGLLSEPWTPELPGLDRFQGNFFHTARWDHDDDLTGRRVAVLGSGASAVQVVPRIQPQVELLHLFQRTPPWVIPHTDHPVRPWLRELYRLAPALQRASRASIFAMRESLVPALSGNSPIRKAMKLNARLHLHRQVHDPELRKRLTPDYEIFCKRIILSSDWYPAIQEPNVELVSGAPSELREHSIVGPDGREREIDTLVFATGFKPTELPIASRVHGREGRSLAAAWAGSPEAYLASTVAGFPNLFIVYGPNSNLGQSSIVYVLESQVNYVIDALRTLKRIGATEFEVRPEAQAAYNAELQERLERTVWNNGGCGSWYFDRNGRNAIQWPGHTFEFRRRTRRFDAAAYRLAAAPAVSSPLAASAAPAT
jgi:cation diffusion facilitator CzcD-associated flavoprotein CzcO